MSEPSPWAGVWIAEDIELIAHGVQSGSWVDASLGMVGAGLDGLAFVSDPIGALLQYGIAWLIEHVEPLSEALDWLAGDPGRIAAHAAAWRGAASSLASEATALAGAVRSEVAGWSGAAAEAYLAWASGREQAVLALGRAAETMALFTEGAGALIGTVRLMVRDAVATVVSRLVVYAAELLATAGLATPLVAEQVATLCAAWAARIARWLRELLASLRRLCTESDKLGGLVKMLDGGGRPAGGGGRGRDPKPGEAGFDGGMQSGPLGGHFAPGVSDPGGIFIAKERQIADRLADEGDMVHARTPDHRVEGLKNPDAMVRRNPHDPGIVTEFKTLESATSGAVMQNILAAGKQVEAFGPGDAVLDGRAAGLTEEVVRQGYLRAEGKALVHGSAMPVSVRVILDDGSIIEFPS